MGDSWADTGDGELLERLSAASGAMMFIVNLTPKTLWVNDKLVEATGYTFDDFAFERFENPFIPADDVTRIVTALTQFLEGDAPVSESVGNRFIDRWGGTLHVRSRITKILWKGEKALLYTTFLEAPDRDQSIELQQRYRSLVEAADDSIVRLTPDLRMQYSNRCFQDLVELKPIVLNSMTFPELVLESHREAVQQQLEGPADRVEVSVPVVGASGREIWLEGAFVRARRGRDAGALQAILRDTTERRRLDALVLQAEMQETLGQLAGGIAHDLNNILTGIMGSATLAEVALARGKPADEALSNIHTAALRAGELSSSMLAFAGEGNAQRVPIDLTTLVAEMKPLLTSAVAKNVQLEMNLTDERLAVLADDNQLRQVVMNLIMNAADASTRGGPVTVEVGCRPEMPETPAGTQVFGELPSGPVAMVRVTDCGVGMEPNLVRRIFDPFFSTKAKGRGLGLAATLGIMTRHEGGISVRSEPGVGTQMELWLPLTAEPLRQAPQPLPTEVIVGEGTVLVVDDEPMIRQLIARTLETMGYAALEADCGEVALELLATHGAAVRLVVLDQTMPGIGGAETLVRLRADFPTLPVMRISGYTADLRAKSADPYTTFLGKPFDTPTLMEMAQRAVLGGKKNRS